MSNSERARSLASAHFPAYFYIVFGALFVIPLLAFGSGLLELPVRWSQQEEYSYGYFIPLISGWLLWTRRSQIAAAMGKPSWVGLLLISLSLALLVLGSVTALFLAIHLGFILCLFGLVLSVGGRPLLRVTFFPIAYLVFAIPLPYFVDAMLSWRLQLMSTGLGVFMLRAFGVPVFAQGNVIDLGLYQLQVVEACSGLRYLYPLMSLGILAAYFYRGPFWQRAVVFLSTIPITIAMNSLRIALVGVSVSIWGTQAADEALHGFEGWVVFSACAAILLLEIWLFSKISGHGAIADVLNPPVPSVPAVARVGWAGTGRLPKQFVAGVALIIAVGVATGLTERRHEQHPARESFVSFPKQLGEWHGSTAFLGADVERFLGLSDYYLADYRSGNGLPVNLYIAYYASQRKGVSPHSPQVCIPGGGWLITHFDRDVPIDPGGGQAEFAVNRALIERGTDRQLVYYWFDQRGRRIANEYLMKWYLLLDAFRLNRTDGALVRLTTPLTKNETPEDGERRLRAVLRLAVPIFPNFIPGRGHEINTRKKS